MCNCLLRTTAVKVSSSFMACHIEKYTPSGSNNFFWRCEHMLVVSIVIDLSVTPDFQCYIHIWPLAVYIVGIEHFLTSAFQTMAFAAQLTVVQTSPFVQNIIQTFLSCRWINIRGGHYYPYQKVICSYAIPSSSISKMRVEPPGMPGCENLP